MLVKSLEDCINNYNKPVFIEEEKILSKLNSVINEFVLEKTDWKTWGIFTKEDCKKRELKLLIGKAKVLLPSGYISDGLRKIMMNKLGLLITEMQDGKELTRKNMLEKFNELTKLI